MAKDGLHNRQKDRGTLLNHRSPESSPHITHLSSPNLSVDSFAQGWPATNFTSTPVSAATIQNFDHYTLPSSTQPSQASSMYVPLDLSQSFQPVHRHSMTYNNFNNAAAQTWTKAASTGFQRNINPAFVPRSFEHRNFGMDEYGALSLQNLEPGACMTDFDTSNEFGYQSSRNATPYLLIDGIGNVNPSSMTLSPKVELELDNAEALFLSKARLSTTPPISATEEGKQSDREATGSDNNDGSLEEPYAKLIYRALMSVPSHSMVLQEIYQWFRENTTKGNSDTRGWMNSIRHNLSMNAAFKKTERKVPGNQSKKSTEWVLEEFAIKDGVQSTTRYRKGTANKMLMRTEHSARNRQLSGRKAGTLSSRGSRQRKGDRLESRLRMANLDTARNSHLPYQLLSQINQRQRSPFTPPHPEVVDSSLCCISTGQQFGVPYDVSYGFEDVQGVLIEDGAVFTSGTELCFYGSHGLPSYNQRI